MAYDPAVYAFGVGATRELLTEPLNALDLRRQRVRIVETDEALAQVMQLGLKAASQPPTGMWERLLISMVIVMMVVGILLSACILMLKMGSIRRRRAVIGAVKRTM